MKTLNATIFTLMLGVSFAANCESGLSEWDITLNVRTTFQNEYLGKYYGAADSLSLFGPLGSIESLGDSGLLSVRAESAATSFYATAQGRTRIQDGRTLSYGELSFSAPGGFKYQFAGFEAHARVGRALTDFVTVTSSIHAPGTVVRYKATSVYHGILDSNLAGDPPTAYRGSAYLSYSGHWSLGPVPLNTSRIVDEQLFPGNFYMSFLDDCNTSQYYQCQYDSPEVAFSNSAASYVELVVGAKYRINTSTSLSLTVTKDFWEPTSGPFNVNISFDSTRTSALYLEPESAGTYLISSLGYTYLPPVDENPKHYYFALGLLLLPLLRRSSLGSHCPAKPRRG